jgi:hypothetical protein
MTVTKEAARARLPAVLGTPGSQVYTFKMAHEERMAH